MTNKPQNVTDNCWYYEEPHGIDVVIWTQYGDGRRLSTSVTIPWAMLRRSLARRDKRKTPKEAA